MKFIDSIFIFILIFYCLGNSSVAQDDQSKSGASSYEIFVVKAISNTKILPDTWPIPGTKTNEIHLTACRGEYEPVSFVIRAIQNITGLLATPTDLKGEHGTIPASAVDIRVVKCWFQAGEKIYETKKRILTPELLLKDDKLIKVDYQGKQNYMRVGPREKEKYVLISGRNSADIMDIRPQDAGELQPTDIEVGTNKQFWITVHVPESAAYGHYLGKIKLTAANGLTNEINLKLQVLPFELEKPALQYGLYYRGKLTRFKMDAWQELKISDCGTISSEWKTPEQYLAEMQNLKDHGVEYPTVYQEDKELLRQELTLRNKVGLPHGPLYLIYVPGNANNPHDQERIKNTVQKFLHIAKPLGYKDVFLYGLDEAEGEALLSQRPAWTAVHQAGGKMFAALTKGNFEKMGDILDIAVVLGPPDEAEAKKYHSIGHKIFNYSNPQVGEETPDTYRHNFGILLWKSGYDGAMNYAYQHSFGYIWNDFDNNLFRDHVFAYPTVNGVIDTIQWEGFREGVDDVRYITTLRKAILRQNSSKIKEANDALHQIENVDPLDDLDKVRENIISWLILLNN
jgi:hypothetical protein